MCAGLAHRVAHACSPLSPPAAMCTASSWHSPAQGGSPLPLVPHPCPQLCRIVLGGMKERGRGLIVNVGSGAATAIPSGPLLAVYTASKVGERGCPLVAVGRSLAQRVELASWPCPATAFPFRTRISNPNLPTQTTPPPPRRTWMLSVGRWTTNTASSACACRTRRPSLSPPRCPRSGEQRGVLGGGFVVVCGFIGWVPMVCTRRGSPLAITTACKGLACRGRHGHPLPRRRARIDAPTPEVWAAAAVRAMGYETVFFPYWFHALQAAAVKLLPASLVQYQVMQIHRSLRRAAYRKKSKAAAELLRARSGNEAGEAPAPTANGVKKDD